jgi:hypothetical protein
MIQGFTARVYGTCDTIKILITFRFDNVTVKKRLLLLLLLLCWLYL